MAIEKIKKLDSVEMVTRDKVRVRISPSYRDTLTGDIQPARDPSWVETNPANPAHQAIIAAGKSLWDTVLNTTGATE